MSMDIASFVSSCSLAVYRALLCFCNCLLGLLPLPLSSSRDDSFASDTTPATSATGKVGSSNDKSDGLSCGCSGFRLWVTTGLLIMACGFYVTRVSSLRRQSSDNKMRGMGNRNPETALLLSSTSGGNGRNPSASIDKRAIGLGSKLGMKLSTTKKSELHLFIPIQGLSQEVSLLTYKTR
jgi:hypothetical protein